MSSNSSLFNFIEDGSSRAILTNFQKSTFKFLLLKYVLNLLRATYVPSFVIDT